MSLENNSIPFVSICCITYNHEKFIRDAIEGFLMQKTDFPFEIIIRDDASTDGTAEIIREYQVSYPDLFRCIFHIQNQYSLGKRPFPETFAMARGKFIALCEGDDYWTDLLKLQKQVDFLETHPECSVCCHKVKQYSEISKAELGFFPPMSGDQIFERNEFYTQNMIHTCSMLFRNIPMEDYFDKISTAKIGDWSLQAFLVQFGNIGYLDQVMSVYRFHSGGIWNSADPIVNWITKAETMEIVIKELGLERNLILRRVLLKYYIHFTSHYFQIKNASETKKYLNKSLDHLRLLTRKQIKKIIPIFGFVYFPWLFQVIKNLRRVLMLRKH